MLLSLLGVYKTCANQLPASHNKMQYFSYLEMSPQFLLSFLRNLSWLLHRRFMYRAWGVLLSAWEICLLHFNDDFVFNTTSESVRRGKSGFRRGEGSLPSSSFGVFFALSSHQKQQKKL